jgi:hypothetical protein
MKNKNGIFERKITYKEQVCSLRVNSVSVLEREQDTTLCEANNITISV